MDLATNRFDHTGTVGSRDDIVLLGERIGAFGDDEVTVVERCTAEFDENVVVTNRRDGGVLGVNEVAKVLGLALDAPLLLRLRCHCVEKVSKRRVEELEGKIRGGNLLLLQIYSFILDVHAGTRMRQQTAC